MSPARALRRVAAAVVLRDRRVLVQTRVAPGPYQGYWEFPGGGLEAGEDAARCARRECREELGLEVRVVDALHEEEWAYADVRVHVAFLLCEPAAGDEPASREGQELRWADADELERLRFLPANARVLELLARRLRSA